MWRSRPKATWLGCLIRMPNVVVTIVWQSSRFYRWTLDEPHLLATTTYGPLLTRLGGLEYISLCCHCTRLLLLPLLPALGL